MSQSLGFALAERRPVRILLLLRAGLHTSYLYDLLPALTVFGLGLAATVAPLTATVLADADLESSRDPLRRQPGTRS